MVTLDFEVSDTDSGGAGGGEGATFETKRTGEGDIPFSDLEGEGDVDALDGGRHIARDAGEATLGTKRTGDGEMDLAGEGDADTLWGDLSGEGVVNFGTNLTGDGDAPFWGLTGEGEALLGCQTGADTCEITRTGEGEAILGACSGKGDASLDGFGGTDGGTLRAGDALK